MGNFFGDIIHGVENFVTGHHDTPDPRKFVNTNQNGLPGTPSGLPSPPSLGLAKGPSGLPSGMPAGFNESAFENTLRTDPDLAGVWQGIVNAGGDVWGFLGNFLPKNADGGIDWGKVGGDIVGFVKNNAKTIIDGAAAIASYQRQGKADDYAKQALSLAQDTYKQNAPLRDQGRANMLNPSANTPDLSALKALATQNSGNPFAKTIPMASIATKPGQMVPPIPAPSRPGNPTAPLPMAAPSAPLTNPVPSGSGGSGVHATLQSLQMATPTVPPVVPTSSAPKPLTLAPKAPALAGQPIGAGLQPSRTTLPFAYE